MRDRAVTDSVIAIANLVDVLPEPGDIATLHPTHSQPSKWHDVVRSELCSDRSECGSINGQRLHGVNGLDDVQLHLEAR